MCAVVRAAVCSLFLWCACVAFGVLGQVVGDSGAAAGDVDESKLGDGGEAKADGEGEGEGGESAAPAAPAPAPTSYAWQVVWPKAATVFLSASALAQLTQVSRPPPPLPPSPAAHIRTHARSWLLVRGFYLLRSPTALAFRRPCTLRGGGLASCLRVLLYCGASCVSCLHVLVCPVCPLCCGVQLVETGSGLRAVVKRVPLVSLDGGTGPEEGVEDFLSRGQVRLVASPPTPPPPHTAHTYSHTAHSHTHIHTHSC